MPPQPAILASSCDSGPAQTLPSLREDRIRGLCSALSLPVSRRPSTATQGQLPPPLPTVLCYGSALLYLAGPERRTCGWLSSSHLLQILDSEQPWRALIPYKGAG